jgi:hypothetical protein
MRCTTAAAVLLAVLPLACADRELPTATDPPQADIVPLAVVLTVENTNDDGPGSLRQTIADAQNGHVITFAPSLAGEVITLSSELNLPRSVTIQGPAAGVTLQGSGDHRILRMGALYEVVLENLIIRGGHTPISGFFVGLGGGIMNEGANLTIRNSTLEHNWASNAGGGIFNGGNGTLMLVGSTVAYNGYDPALGATSFGGGITNSGANMTLVNSTVSANTAGSAGGGIYNFEGSSTLIHATVADNGAFAGGGIYSRSSQVPTSITVRNSIVAANASSTAANGPDIRITAAFSEPSTVTMSYSLIGTTTGYDIASDGGGNQIGVNAGFELDGFGKALLADNGGLTQTHALVDGSLAIDTADPVLCDADPVSNRDQRGVARPQGVNCDIGAFEATGAAPPPEPEPAIVSELNINSQGSVDRTSGDAAVHGSITCSTPGPVQLTVTLLQEQKQRGVTSHVAAESIIVIDCTGTRTWAAGMTADNGIFTNGKAEASVAIDVVGPGPQTATVQLRWSK